MAATTQDAERSRPLMLIAYYPTGSVSPRTPDLLDAEYAPVATAKF